jgi:hypothetical protein
MQRAFREGGLANIGRGALNAPFALLEQTMRPIMEYVVPRQKLGVFADMAKRELLRLGPAADMGDVREAMRKAWDSVDNRMGQVVYDNLFYNRAIKDMALLAFRAYGWQLGKYREGLGAAADLARAGKAVATLQKPEVTHRMAYAMALPLMVGTMGGLVHYLFTGKMPVGLDWFIPQTGEKDDKGNPLRLNFPSYIKDVVAYAKRPLTSFGHSLNPLGAAMLDLLANRDFYDVRIRNPDDPLWKQGSDVAAFAAEQAVPFSVSGAMKLRDDAAPLWKQVFPFFGVTPVPSRITMTPAQEMAADMMAEQMNKAPRTPEQFDRSKLIKEIVKDINTNGWRSGMAKLAEGLRGGNLTPGSVTTVIDRMHYTPLQFQVHHLDVDASMKVWRVANEAEQQQIRTIMVLKIGGSKATAPQIKRLYLAEVKAGR